MKPAANIETLRETLSRLAGHDVGETHPEFFMSPDTSAQGNCFKVHGARLEEWCQHPFGVPAAQARIAFKSELVFFHVEMFNPVKFLIRPLAAFGAN
ncbi:MAG TPA: hypothetical protein VIK53_19480 [Verrucomicrobiae bacterium]